MNVLDNIEKEISIPPIKNRSLKGQIVADVGKFSFATAVSQICGLLRGYFSAHLLGPNIWGVWHTALLVQNYTVFVGLGVGNAMHREIPILRGKGKIEKSLKIIETSFSYNLITAILLFLMISLSTYFLNINEELLLSLRFMSIIVFMNCINGIYNVLFKAYNRFNLLSQMSIIRGIIVIFTIPLIYIFSFPGFLAGQVLILLFTLVYSVVNFKEKIKLKIDINILKKLIIIGFPIALISLATTLFATIDRILILNILGFEDLGFYSVAGIFIIPVTLICNSLNSVMYPRFGEKFGSNQNERDLGKYIKIPIKEISLFAPIIVGAICIIIPTTINLFLPEYTNSILPSQILIFGLFFRAAVGTAGNFFLVTNRQLFYLIIILFSCFLNFILSFVMIKLGFGIIGVAIGTSLSYFIFFLIMLVVAMKYCFVSKADVRSLIFSILLPISIIAIIVFLVTNYVNFYGSSLMLQQICEVLIRLVVYIVLSSFLIYKFFNESKVVHIIREMLEQRRKEKR